MKNSFILLAAMLFVAGSLAAQQSTGISVEGGSVDDRGSARVLFWNDKANAAAGQYAFNYGRPEWKAAYENRAAFDKMTDGKVWRMGSNYWSNLYTDVPLTIGGISVKPGLYFLGLNRSADGATWSLAFIDPSKVRAARIDAFQISKAKVEFTAPMTVDAAPAEKVGKLTITATTDKADKFSSTLKVAWGTLALTTSVKATVAQ